MLSVHILGSQGVRPETPRGLSGFFLALVLLSAAPRVMGQEVQFSGDANVDAVLDVGDVTSINLATTTDTMATGVRLLALDADQSGEIDLADQDYVVNVLLGLAAPIPIVGPPAAAIVSFWFQEDAGSLPADETFVVPAMASFWFQEEVADVAADETFVVPAFASFWFPPLVPAATDADARQLGTPSFLRQ